MNLQEYFDETVAHLRSMPRRAWGEGVDSDGYTDEGCLYLTEDGLKCAVGYWIPDGHEAQHVLVGVMAVADEYPDLDGVAWPKGALWFASKLQAIHDDENNWSAHGFNVEGEKALLTLARENDLTFTPEYDRM